MTQATPEEPAGPGRAIWPKKRLQTSAGRRAGDAVVATLTRWGLVPHTYVMTTIGRKTGRPRSTPVTIVEQGEKRWLVAPYGPVPWVLNARAAGRVTISRRGHSKVYAVTEVDPEQAGAILKDYLKIAGATKTFFEATKNSPVETFTAEASRHPVFELDLDRRSARMNSSGPATPSAAGAFPEPHRRSAGTLGQVGDVGVHKLLVLDDRRPADQQQFQR